MDAARWAHIKALFDEALEQAPSARAAFVTERAEGDADLEDEVLALLSAEDEAPQFFGAYTGGALAFLPGEGLGEGPGGGARVGPYEIEREIGRGGMGVVYLARRADGQFQQRVALKLLPPGFDTEDLVARFLAERQILASLEHPGIARFLGGGVTEGGQPYFVMEYVEGEPIDVFCDERRLSISKRLRLFAEVARAVAYAHGKLVVHRDLKLSNILVTEDESGTPHVKLLDFGVAKLLDESAAAAAAPLTRTGERWLTPEYAAPEQLRGEPLTTAADVYALGVLLYELLTGHRPYHVAGARTAHALERAVLETRPRAPSTVVQERSGEAAPEAVSAARGTSPGRLRRRLRGDLDTIVMKALRKTPARRYASAEAFAVDVERHLQGLPVNARPDTPGYRLRKFVRRHRWGFAVSVLIALLTLGYAASVTLQAREIARERDKAEQMSAFLVELFRVSDPQEGTGDAVTARALLDRGAQQAQADLQDRPETRAMLMDVIGRIYGQLGLYDEAGPLLAEALEERQRVLDEGDPDVAASLHALGALRHAQGRYDPAQELLEEALRRRRARYGAEHASVAEAMNSLARLRLSRGHLSEAESLFTEALAMRRRLYGPAHAAVAESLNDLAAALRVQGRYVEAEKHYRMAHAMNLRVLGPSHLRVAESLNNLAALLQNQGRYDEAEDHARQALALYRRLFGSDHPDVATNLSNLAYILQKKGDFAPAESLYTEALAMRRTLLGDKHLRVANSYNSLAAVLQDQGRYDEAEPYARQALALYREALGTEHRLVAQALNNLAWLLRNKGDLAGAEPLFREVLAMRQRFYGSSHPQVAQSMSYLAELLQARGQLAKAETLYRDALAMQRDLLPPEHPQLAVPLAGLGDLLAERGQAIAAEPLLREALSIQEGALPSGHWRTAKTKAALGRCLSAQGRLDEAEPLLDAAFAALKASRSLSDPETQRTLASLIALCDARGNARKARAHRALMAEAR